MAATASPQSTESKLVANRAEQARRKLVLDNLAAGYYRSDSTSIPPLRCSLALGKERKDRAAFTLVCYTPLAISGLDIGGQKSCDTLHRQVHTHTTLVQEFARGALREFQKSNPSLRTIWQQ